MILTWAELYGKAKVGDRVRAVPRRRNCCRMLGDGESENVMQEPLRIGVITGLTRLRCAVDGCDHALSGESWLELMPARAEWSRLEQVAEEMTR